jgi:hypothetical protein
MATTIWHYAANQFDNCTIQSKKRMNRISSDHESKLVAGSGDPVIAGLRVRFDPVRTAYSNCYMASISANAVYKGKTLNFENYTKQLSGTKIEEWDVRIQVVYRKDSPTYVELLPRGREPFQKGTNDQRIEEVTSLGARLTSYAGLLAVKTDVDTFAGDMRDARLEQQEKEELVAESSDALETKRKATAEMMYGNLGVLMDKFRRNPTEIERYFDLEAIRNTGPEQNETFEGTIAGGDSVNILSGGFDAETEFLFANPGIARLAYFTSETADGVYSGTGVEVAPGESINKTAGEIGNPDYTFLNVTNLDAENQGNYSVTVM